MRPRIFSRGCRQQGFVLAITLWLLAGIAVAVGLMMLWARDQVARSEQMRGQVEDVIAMHETRDTVLYLASTRDVTLAGLATKPLKDDVRAIRKLDDFGGLTRDPLGGELRLDDAHYQGVRATEFSLQDEAGLFPMVLPTPASLDAFLRSQGVDEKVIPHLRDTFLDYTDEDNLVRLNGAEADDYRRAHRSGPANRRLLSPPELGRILGWDELPSGQLAQIEASISPYYAGPANLNTAPATLLPLWVEGCPDACDRMVQRRIQSPFHNGYEVQGALGTRLLGDGLVDYRYVAGDTLRVTLWGRTGPGQRFHVKLTPMADKKAPWSILASYSIPRPQDDDPAHDTGSDLFSDKNRDSGQ